MPKVHRWYEFNKVAFNESSLARFEHKDCSVCALATVLGINYDEAHTILKSAGRQDRKGFDVGSFLNKTPSLCGYKIIPMYVHWRNRSYKDRSGKRNQTPQPTLLNLRDRYPQGRYYVTINRHALAMIDGVLFDRGISARLSRVHELWLFVKESEC